MYNDMGLAMSRKAVITEILLNTTGAKLMNKLSRLFIAVFAAILITPVTVIAASTDSDCVLFGRFGGLLITEKQAGQTEKETRDWALKQPFSKRTQAMIQNMIRFIYMADNDYLTDKYLYQKCKAGHFD